MLVVKKRGLSARGCTPTTKAGVRVEKETLCANLVFRFGKSIIETLTVFVNFAQIVSQCDVKFDLRSNEQKLFVRVFKRCLTLLRLPERNFLKCCHFPHFPG